jgi:predicted nicotinamide N-methyase
MSRRHPVIKTLDKSVPTPDLYGVRVWQSSYMVMDYLERNPVARGLRLVEIGCGWGLLGIFCAKSLGLEVLLTDADERVFPYVEAHRELNGAEIRTERRRFEDLTDRHLHHADILVGGDICFWPEMVGPLQKLVQRALACGVGKVILADPGRSTFMRLAEHCRDHFSAEILPWRCGTRGRSEGYLLVVSNPLPRNLPRRGEKSPSRPAGRAASRRPAVRTPGAAGRA